MSKSIADIIETHGVSELRVKEAYNMAPWTKTACLLIDPILPREL